MSAYEDHVRQMAAAAPPLTDDQRTRISGLLRGVPIKPMTRQEQVNAWVSRTLNESPERSVARGEFFKQGIAAGMTETELIKACNAIGAVRGRTGRISIPRTGSDPRRVPRQPGATPDDDLAATIHERVETAVRRDDRTRQAQRPRTSHADCDHDNTRNARQKCLRDRDRLAGAA